ncbi:type VII secretion target [Williamsia deligens]|uniref:Type VII secretion target n=1 Tax=Williamsia deligens TaxID=321325 RepID=A0ABW3GE23_9NOCA|nr:type VII secretion target [Williamsia deligens]MCP2196152.1 Excreted virulence factor EspC, type VII ESX diderm [Williamsia deligens]
MDSTPLPLDAPAAVGPSPAAVGPSPSVIDRISPTPVTETVAPAVPASGGVSVETIALDHLARALDTVGESLASLPSGGEEAVGALAVALGLVAAQFVTALLSAAVEQHRDVADAAGAIRQIGAATAASRQAYAAQDRSGADALRTAGAAA